MVAGARRIQDFATVLKTYDNFVLFFFKCHYLKSDGKVESLIIPDFNVAVASKPYDTKLFFTARS